MSRAWLSIARHWRECWLGLGMPDETSPPLRGMYLCGLVAGDAVGTGRSEPNSGLRLCVEDVYHDRCPVCSGELPPVALACDGCLSTQEVPGG